MAVVFDLVMLTLGFVVWILILDLEPSGIRFMVFAIGWRIGNFLVNIKLF